MNNTYKKERMLLSLSWDIEEEEGRYVDLDDLFDDVDDAERRKKVKQQGGKWNDFIVDWLVDFFVCLMVMILLDGRARLLRHKQKKKTSAYGLPTMLYPVGR